MRSLLSAPKKAANRHRFAIGARHGSWWLVGVSTLLVLALWALPLVQRLNLLAYDLLAPAQTVAFDSPVVIAIDDASLAELGRWPWPRDRYVALLDKLGETDVAAIGLDVLFAEPDLANPGGDAALAAALACNPRVVLPVAPEQASPPRLLGLGSLSQEPGTPLTIGHVDVELDLDGQVRRLYLIAGYGQANLPAFALVMRQLVDSSLSSQQLPGLRSALPPKTDPKMWVRDFEEILPHLQPVVTLSFAQVLRSPEMLSRLRGRAVFIGVTATGLGADLVTPLLSQLTSLPAVQLQALAYAALAQRALLQRGPAWVAALVALALISSLALWPT
jgi:CHASE2 domain-containing sensor protein